MNIQKEKCRQIKTLLQSLSGIEDIGKRSRERPYPEYKQMFCKLCKEFTKASLSMIGEVLGGYNHATALHNYKKFDDLLETHGLDNLRIYIEAKDLISKQFISFEQTSILSKNSPEELLQLQAKNRIALIRVIEKSHSVINKKDCLIKSLEPLLRKASLLLKNPTEENKQERLILSTTIIRTLSKK